MAYFQNGTESEMLDAECKTCALGNDTCPVYLAQCLFNSDQMREGQERIMQLLHLLIDDDGICQVKRLLENSRGDPQQEEKENRAFAEDNQEAGDSLQHACRACVRAGT